MFRKLLSVFLDLALILSLAACAAEPAETTAPATTAPVQTTVPPETEPDQAAIYDLARKPYDEAQALTLNITDRISYTVAGVSFAYSSVQTLQLLGLGTDNVQVRLSEVLTAGDYKDTFEEYYADGMLYSQVYDAYLFKGELAQDAYLSQFVPAVLLDAALYGNITAETNAGGTLLKFESPTAAESWALPEGAEFQQGSGTAFLAQDGTLERTGYTLSYTHGPAAVTRTVQVTPTIETGLTLSTPANGDQYRMVDSILGVRAYDMALIAPYVSTSVSTGMTETIISEAAGCVLQTVNTADYSGTGKDLLAKVGYSATYAQGGQQDSYSQEEIFRDGAYTFTADGSEPESGEVSAQDMFTYAQEGLWENIVNLDYFENVTAEEVGGLLYLELDFTEEYGDRLEAYCSSVLFNDEAYLKGFSSDYRNTECVGYMSIDPVTGFPTATGITFSGAHTIEGQDYAISMQVDQSFDMASMNVYESVTGEAPEEAEPETKATPLFYHVTGSDGQEMWLLGTIHVGDSRTAYLPQEIYDALEASDALAVEFDTQAFEQAIETDEQLIAQVALCYFYPNGSKTSDHLEEELYRDALKMLKASGNYNANAEYMQPYLWGQSIENFYLQTGYELVPEKGVDNRLLTLAKASGKEIRDIESGLFQVRMMTGFSEELQELLLDEAISTTMLQFQTDTAELYELWCAGDEAQLREMLSDEVDTSEFTEEELAEYETQKPLIDEYNKAMSYDRNDGMLDVAKTYLESGETVFYAVGLAHLLNNVNGLVDTLRAAGYTVELVTYP